MPVEFDYKRDGMDRYMHGPATRCLRTCSLVCSMLDMSVQWHGLSGSKLRIAEEPALAILRGLHSPAGQGRDRVCRGSSWVLWHTQTGCWLSAGIPPCRQLWRAGIAGSSGCVVSRPYSLVVLIGLALAAQVLLRAVSERSVKRSAAIDFDDPITVMSAIGTP